MDRRESMNNYELTFLMDAQLAPEKQEEVITKFLDMLKSKGAEVLNVEKWGKRKLAYTIDDRQYAYYLVTQFEAPPSAITEVEHFLKVTPSIFRYLVLHRDPKIMKMIRLETERISREASRLAELERNKTPEENPADVGEIKIEIVGETNEVITDVSAITGGKDEDLGIPEKE
jgi:small subunit ribosomal protein S6